jgi:mannose-6-phosphate isomerase-like protein (cupin superfamily)
MRNDSSSLFQIEHLGPWSDLGRYTYGPMVGKVFTRESLGLTGCEISLHLVKAHEGMPFLHAHRQNEEVYLVIEGDGVFHLDGQELTITEGDAIRVSPTVVRGYRAGDRGMRLLCVQAKAGSLEQATKGDGVLVEAKASWMG